MLHDLSSPNGMVSGHKGWLVIVGRICPDSKKSPGGLRGGSAAGGIVATVPSFGSAAGGIVATF